MVNTPIHHQSQPEDILSKKSVRQKVHPTLLTLWRIIEKWRGTIRVEITMRRRRGNRSFALGSALFFF
jgi:hypothetical protein